MVWIARAGWIGYCVALSAMVAAVAMSNRSPLSFPVLAVAFGGTHFVAGLVIARWRALALALLLIAGAIVVGRETGNWLEGFAVAVATPIAVALIGIGVLAARLLSRRAGTAASSPRWALAPAIIVAFGVFPLALSEFQRHTVVRVGGSRPLLIDESTGRIHGVGIGSRTRAVRATFGAALPPPPNGEIGPRDMDGADFLAGPSWLPNLRDESDIRYEHLFFAASAGQVRYLVVTDRRSRLRSALGPGDSISLARDAYPDLRCEDGDAGVDEPVPFPTCHGKIAPGVWIYIAGDYDRPGAPITAIWFAGFPLGL